MIYFLNNNCFYLKLNLRFFFFIFFTIRSYFCLKRFFFTCSFLNKYYVFAIVCKSSRPSILYLRLKPVCNIRLRKLSRFLTFLHNYKGSRKKKISSGPLRPHPLPLELALNGQRNFFFSFFLVLK